MEYIDGLDHFDAILNAEDSELIDWEVEGAKRSVERKWKCLLEHIRYIRDNSTPIQIVTWCEKK